MRSRAPVAGRRGAATVDIDAGYAALAVDEPLPPDCALLCGLAAPPQPAAPSAAEAPTMTTSLRTFGFMELLRDGDGRQDTAGQETWSARSLGAA